MDDQRTWAMALADELGLGVYRPGSFATNMARAILSADSDNMRRIRMGFPDLFDALTTFREYGSAMLLAVAEGDAVMVEAAHLARQVEGVA